MAPGGFRSCGNPEDARRILVGAATVVDSGLDFYDPAEWAYQCMEAEDVGHHPNEWAR